MTFKFICIMLLSWVLFWSVEEVKKSVRPEEGVRNISFSSIVGKFIPFFVLAFFILFWNSFVVVLFDDCEVAYSGGEVVDVKGKGIHFVSPFVIYESCSLPENDLEISLSFDDKVVDKEGAVVLGRIKGHININQEFIPDLVKKLSYQEGLFSEVFKKAFCQAISSRVVDDSVIVGSKKSFDTEVQNNFKNLLRDRLSEEDLSFVAIGPIEIQSLERKMFFENV